MRVFCEFPPDLTDDEMRALREARRLFWRGQIQPRVPFVRVSIPNDELVPPYVRFGFWRRLSQRVTRRLYRGEPCYRVETIAIKWTDMVNADGSRVQWAVLSPARGARGARWLSRFGSR